jgi:ferric-dicitrate binding protein FerR (iron transport regulator)
MSAASFPQDASKNSWLSGVVVKFERMLNDAASDIARYEKMIMNCDATISKSEAIVTLAEKKGNVKAEQIARTSSAKAQEARKKNEANKATAESMKAWAEEAIARIRNLLTVKDAGIQVVLSYHKGTVKYFSKRLNKMMAFDDAGAGSLEPGDEIVTSGGSSAAIEFVNGGRVVLGENSRLKIQESDNESQVVMLSEGKINAELVKLLGELKAKIRKKFEVRTPQAVCAVRGTKFLASTNDTTGTELVVLEDSVEVRGVHDKKNDVARMVYAGYRLKSSKDGIISEPEKIDLDGIERWWEK